MGAIPGSREPNPQAVSALPGFDPERGTYRGWKIAYDFPPIPIPDLNWSATGPNYDASWEGEEDGWVGNGEYVTAATLEAVVAEIDAYLESVK